MTLLNNASYGDSCGIQLDGVVPEDDVQVVPSNRSSAGSQKTEAADNAVSKRDGASHRKRYSSLTRKNKKTSDASCSARRRKCSGTRGRSRSRDRSRSDSRKLSRKRSSRSFSRDVSSSSSRSSSSSSRTSFSSDLSEDGSSSSSDTSSVSSDSSVDSPRSRRSRDRSSSRRHRKRRHRNRSHSSSQEREDDLRRWDAVAIHDPENVWSYSRLRQAVRLYLLGPTGLRLGDRARTMHLIDKLDSASKRRAISLMKSKHDFKFIWREVRKICRKPAGKIDALMNLAAIRQYRDEPVHVFFDRVRLEGKNLRTQYRLRSNNVQPAQVVAILRGTQDRSASNYFLRMFVEGRTPTGDMFANLFKFTEKRRERSPSPVPREVCRRFLKNLCRDHKCRYYHPPRDTTVPLPVSTGQPALPASYLPPPLPLWSPSPPPAISPRERRGKEGSRYRRRYP